MDPTTVLILLLSFVAGALSVWLLLRLRPGRQTSSAPGEPPPSPASPPDTEAHIPVLQALARGAPLAEVMRQICLLAEQALPDAICVTAVLDPSSHRLNMYASRLAQDLLDVLAAVDGDAGAGTAVAAIVRGETVICEDIATDPVWSRCRALPLEQNLRSSVSVPIVGTEEAVVGSVTAFHATPLRPSAAALHTMRVIAEVAAVALAHERVRELLRENTTRLDLAQQLAGLSYWERDLLANRTVSFARLAASPSPGAGVPVDLEDVFSRVVEEDRPILEAAAEEVAQSSRSLSPLELRLRQADGSIRHIRTERLGTYDESGRIVRVIGTVQDVTAQRSDAAHLKASEERFRLVAEQTGQLILDCRLDEGELRCAGAVGEILGPEAAASPVFKLDMWRRFVHPEDTAIVEQSIRRVLHGERVSAQCRLLRLDGKVLDVEATGSAVIGSNGRATRIIAAVSNISDRRRVEAERQRYLAQLSFLADAARKVNSVLSVEELLQVITDTARDLVGTHAAIGVLMPNEAWPHELRATSGSGKYALEIIDDFATALSLGDAETLGSSEVKLVRRPRAAMTDDEQHDLVAHLIACGVLTVPLVSSSGDVSGVIHVVDKREGDFGPIDERVLMQLADLASVGIENARLYAELEARVRRRTQELEQSNRELEAFSYSVSHDLRGPLRAISGFAGLLHAQHFDELDGDSRRYLERIEAGTVRMSALIDDLLELGRVTRVELNREPVDLSALAESVVSRMREGSAMARTVASIEPGLRVYGDVRLLEIVLENLLDNSCKFAAVREVPRIEFGTCPDAQGQAFFVRDNGVGFDPRYASNLFGVFQRLHSMTDFPGTGVGLATVQRIVQRHGGRVWAEAEVDAGATFYFTIGGGSDDGSIYSAGGRQSRRRGTDAAQSPQEQPGA
jgi:PAS domain S-box-containing protein